MSQDKEVIPTTKNNYKHLITLNRVYLDQMANSSGYSTFRRIHFFKVSLQHSHILKIIVFRLPSDWPSAILDTQAGLPQYWTLRLAFSNTRHTGWPSAILDNQAGLQPY
jgi:hypothetical protein